MGWEFKFLKFNIKMDACKNSSFFVQYMEALEKKRG